MNHTGHTVKWIDHGRKAKCPADPRYPDGIDVTAANVRNYLGFDVKAGRFCKVKLPYPAPQCGVWIIRCSKCGMSVAVTTAGRRDDPRSVEVTCIEKNSP